MATNNKNPSDPFEKNISQNVLATFVFRHLPFWPVFLINVTVCLVACYFYIRVQNPVYESNAMILLKDQKNGDSQNALLFSELGINSSAKSVENEIEVLKSRILLSHVATDMVLYSNIYKKGKFRSDLIYPGPIKFVATNPKLIEDSPPIPISFQFLKSRNYFIISGKKYKIGSTINTQYGQFTTFEQPVFNYSIPMAKGNYFLKIQSIKNVAASLYANLNVIAGSGTGSSASKASSLISLKFTDNVPLRAEDILNNLIRVYNKAGIDDKNTTTANTLNFVNDRLEIVTKDLSAIENNLQHFRTKEGVIDLTAEGQAFLQNVQRTDESASQVQIQLDVLNNIEKYVVKKGQKPGTVPATLGITDPVLLSLLDKLYLAEMQLDQQMQTSGENSPTVITLNHQIEQIRASLLEIIHNIKTNLVSTADKLKSDINKYSGILNSIPVKERSLLEISREQATKNSIYTYLLQKREESALAYASAVADSRVVNYAETKRFPVKPVPMNIYLIGLFAGLITGVIFVIIKEQYNQEVLFRSEIERNTDVPILSEFVHDSSGDNLVIKDGKRTVIAEQFRALRTSLSYIGSGNIQDNKTILLTSSISGEGKSFVGLNLAISLSITGKRVIILEFDLRKPKLSKMLEIAQEPGIANYLAGLCTLNDITVQLSEKNLNNLFVLPAGTIPPNPTELMLNGRLDVLMTQLKNDYDYVIIDSPPIGLVTDAKILNKYVDTCLYMVRHKYTPRHYLKLIQYLYNNNELKNLYIIFNGIKARGVMGYYGGSRGYGYGQGYGQGYGYGYTEETKKKKNKFWSFFNSDKKK